MSPTIDDAHYMSFILLRDGFIVLGLQIVLWVCKAYVRSRSVPASVEEWRTESFARCREIFSAMQSVGEKIHAYNVFRASAPPWARPVIDRVLRLVQEEEQMLYEELARGTAPITVAEAPTTPWWHVGRWLAWPLRAWKMRRARKERLHNLAEAQRMPVKTVFTDEVVESKAVAVRRPSPPPPPPEFEEQLDDAEFPSPPAALPSSVGDVGGRLMMRR